MWSARQSRKMGRRVAGLLGGLLATIILVAAPAAAAFEVGPINLSNSPLIPSVSPAIAVTAIAVNAAGRVFVAWKEGNAIFFRRSQPTQGSCGGGLKFDEMPVSLWAGPVAPSGPALAANNNGEVFVAWQASSAVWFNRSTNDGQAFFDLVPPSPVNLGSSSSAMNVPSVAADNAGGVFVAWSNGSPGEIFFARSMNSGVGFDVPAANVSGTPLNSRAPSVTTDGSNVFLAWEDGNFPIGSPLSLSILYKKFGRSAILTDVAGLATTNLSNGLGFAFNPNLAFDRNLSVVFGTFNGPSFYHRSLGDDGITFSAPENVSGTMQRLSPGGARAARRNGSAMVAWSEELVGNAEIRYRLLGNGAMVSPDTFAPTPGRSASPAAAMDSTGRLLVAWQETVNGNDEIYMSYRGGTSGVPATVWAAPRVLNYRTTGRGTGVQPNFTLFIELPDGSAGDIDLSTVKLNGHSALLAPSALGDANGNGIPDRMVKFNRSIFDGAGIATAAQSTGNYTVDYTYTVTGNTSKGCFSGGDEVQIMR